MPWLKITVNELYLKPTRVFCKYSFELVGLLGVLNYYVSIESRYGAELILDKTEAGGGPSVFRNYKQALFLSRTAGTLLSALYSGGPGGAPPNLKRETGNVASAQKVRAR